MRFNRIKELRENIEMTQQEIADIIGVTRGTYCMWEIGRDIFPLRKLNIISNTFGVSIDYLLGLTNVKNYKIRNKEIDLEVVGNNLYNLRKKLNLTQKEIAEAINTSQSNWWSYEKGRHLIITPFIYSLAQKYNVSIDELLGKI